MDSRIAADSTIAAAATTAVAAFRTVAVSRIAVASRIVAAAAVVAAAAAELAHPDPLEHLPPMRTHIQQALPAALPSVISVNSVFQPSFLRPVLSAARRASAANFCFKAPYIIAAIVKIEST